MSTMTDAGPSSAHDARCRPHRRRRRSHRSPSSLRPPLLDCAAELPFGNPLFAAPGLSPSPAQNPVFSPATLGTAPQSAIGMRRLGALPPSQLQAAAAAAGGSPASSDAAMEDDEGFMDEEEGGQPPADSLAVASPGAAGGAGSRERPEEDEFASVLGAGEGRLQDVTGAVVAGFLDSMLATRRPGEAACLCSPARARVLPLLGSWLPLVARHMASCSRLRWRPPFPACASACRPAVLHSLPTQAPASVLYHTVMRGEVDAAEAIREYAAICRQRAAALKEQASSQLQRAARCAAWKVWTFCCVCLLHGSSL